MGKSVATSSKVFKGAKHLKHVDHTKQSKVVENNVNTATFANPSEPFNKASEKVNLTKQQKRDLRRNSNIPLPDVPVALSTSTKDSPIAESAVMDEPVKLTKQQKRDLKRKAQSASPSSSGTIGDSNNSSKSGSAMKGGFKMAPKELKENTSVYRRAVVYPPEFTNYRGKNDRFVRPSDSQYNDIVASSYGGLVVESPDKFRPAFHYSFKAALQQLEADNLYQFDLTQPTGLGTKVAKTFVTRCLVGDAGITYKYLGLRMFVHPWNEGEVGATAATVEIGRRNRELIRHTEKLLKQSGKSDTGSCQFNLTLINRCYPEGAVVKLKEEPFFKKDKCTVSWHADSSLDHYSSIAVYHCLKSSESSREDGSAGTAAVEVDQSKNEAVAKNAQKDKPKPVSNKTSRVSSWELALRLHFNAEGPNAGKPVIPSSDVSLNSSSVTPALAVPLPDQFSYFLLDDFNHHHQHSVLAGSADRYASTHRVSRVEGHTYEYIKNKCQSALQQKLDLSLKSLRLEQISLSEVEFEWLWQYYVQGPLHHQLHSWWHEPMKVLLDLWMRLEQRTNTVIQALRDAALGVEDGDAAASANGDSRKKLMKRVRYAECVTSLEVYDTLITFLEERQAKRYGWRERYTDPLYKKQSVECQPIAVPFPVVVSSYQRSEDLSEELSKIEEWKVLFAQKQLQHS